MMRNAFIFSLLCCSYVSLYAQLFPRLGGQRAGISALTFLKMEVSPRAMALGGSSVCLSGDVYAAQTNPANLSDVEHFALGLSNTFWAAGINYAHLSSHFNTKLGHFGISLASLNSGTMEVRTVFQPNGTGEFFSANYYTAGLSYAKQLTDNFSYGLTVKYVEERLAEFSARTGVVDIGFIYRLDVKDIRFAVAVQNFGPNSQLSGSTQRNKGLNNQAPAIEPEDYPAPTVFKLGISMKAYASEDGSQSLTASLQLNHPNDNAENIRIGVEYQYRSLLYLRAGYKINVEDQNYPSAGLGFRMRLGRNPLQVDYAVDPLQYLGLIHSIGLSFYNNPISKEKR